MTHRRRAGAAAILLIAAGSIARAAAENQTAPSPALEEVGARLVAAINADDEASRRALLPQVFSEATLEAVGTERLLRFVAGLRQQLGRITLHHSEVAEHGRGADLRRVLHVFVRQEADGRFKDLQARLDPAPPHAIKEVVFLAEVAEPVYLPNGDITAAETLAWLDRYVTRLVEAEGLSGSLLVARGDEALFERSFGFEDAGRTRPVVAGSRFAIASGGKMFTALAVARLVAAGKLSWDAPIAPLLPELPPSPHLAACRLRHLLSHTSGIREYWTEEFHALPSPPRTLREYLPHVLKVGTAFAPGEGFAYSNSNFILLGLILERVSGEDYFAHVAHQVFEPAGMRATLARQIEGPGVAEPLAREGAGWRRIEREPGGGSSAGGALSTPRDLLRFARALRQATLVPGELLRTLTSSQIGDHAREEDYGFGFQLFEAGGARSWGHGGQAPGAGFLFRYFPDRDLTVVACTNQDNGAFDDLAKNVVKLVTGQR
ncbi:MAG TPA: serine hydrolase domain-containing protein [Thermoanaerobaculia bacterium]|nr:serine hydrolase domain-containing protein [Thermoanaerobaculia bacterium]